jgi:hypothetical protein
MFIKHYPEAAYMHQQFKVAGSSAGMHMKDHPHDLKVCILEVFSETKVAITICPRIFDAYCNI